ncbi:MAG: PIN/TRAM domain-containing protein [Candidatus Limnocylindrales bacterium]
MIRFVRASGGALGAILAIALAGGSQDFFDPSAWGRLVLSGWIVAWAVLGYSIMPYITVQPAQRMVRGAMALSSGDFVAGILGLLVGLVIGVLLGLPLANAPEPWAWVLPIGVSVVLGLGMMGLTVAKRHDLFEAATRSGLLARSDAKPPETSLVGPRIYVDTSAVIDGRITDVAASGFLVGTLVVPRFVLAELQRIADHADQGRRTRGRRGLETLSLLQKDPRTAVELTDEDDRTVDAVDAKLLSLARQHAGAILTTDYNLNRVAQLEGVRVLNLNHLANALKPAFLPGEDLTVRVIQQGKEPGQGVAFLDDGTMVVVENGGMHLERDLVVTVTRVLQTVAGRMVFAHPRA